MSTTQQPPTTAHDRAAVDDHGIDSRAVRLEAQADTPEAAVDAVPVGWGGSGWRTRPTSGMYSFHYLAIGDSRLRMGRSRMNGWLRGTLTPGPDYLVPEIARGTVVPDLRVDSTPMRHNVPSLWRCDRNREVEARDHDVRLVHLDRGFVRTVADQDFALPAGELRFEIVSDPDEAAVDGWHAALDGAVHALVDHGADAPAWHAAVRSVADAFLVLFPPQTQPAPDPLGSVRSKRMRVAIAHLRTHTDGPVPLEELCAVSGLSPRGLQDGFQRVFGMAPTTYHRGLRLDQVREDLLSSDPSTTTVGEVARRRGFMHLGRFSAAYQRQHGDYPRTTLRR